MLFLLVNMSNINVFVYISSKLSIFSILKICQLNSYKYILNYSALCFKRENILSEDHLICKSEIIDVDEIWRIYNFMLDRSGV